MNPPDRQTPWEQIAAAARRRGATEPVRAEFVLPPPGFAARLAAKWAELRANETFRLWCRWSLRAALAGLLAAGIVALIPARPPATPLHAPGVEVPTFSKP